MGFWNNVEAECEYRNISRKELAAAAGFSVNTISTGLKRNGMPEADLALRISRALNVPLENLLETTNSMRKDDAERIKKQQKLFSRYLPIIEKLDSLPTDLKNAVITIINGTNSNF